MKKQKPETEIHYLTKKKYKEVLEENPYIDRLILFDDGLGKLIRQLRKEKYDFIVDLHRNLRTLRLKTSLMRPSASFHKLNFQKWLLVNFKINNLEMHSIVDRYLQTVKKLGVANDGDGLDYFLPEAVESRKGQVIQPKEAYIAVVLAATFFTKKFPAEKLAKVLEPVDKSVVLLGGQNEAETGDCLEKLFPEKVLNMCGKLSLHESALYVKYAEKVLTNDTGLMHIAAAFRKEVVSTWGNTVPEFGMFPYFGNQTKLYDKSHLIQIRELACRPCSKLGYKKKCPKGHFKCMMELDDQKIIDLLND